ncbi:MAG: hypothetical protein FVQ80_03310 [Planctomycetes bacterium]|nr:hypothetical protein [Planctomycetota bacterium]
MQEDTKAKLVFFIVGALLWALCGSMVGMTSFKPILPLEELSENQELANKIMKIWLVVELKAVGIWAICGGVLGIFISRLYIFRPSYEHFSPVPKVEGIPRGCGPETIAEMKTSFHAWVIGIIIAVCLVIFVLPLLENPDFVVVNSLHIRIIIGVIGTLLMTVLILPFSLKVLSKLLLKRQNK